MYCKNQWILATGGSLEALRIIILGSQITAHYAGLHFWTCSDMRPIMSSRARRIPAHYAGLHAGAEIRSTIVATSPQEMPLPVIPVLRDIASTISHVFGKQMGVDGASDSLKLLS